MYEGKTVAVVVPALDEEKFIAQVLNTIPAFVDKIYVVNDGSSDNTHEVMQSIAKQNVKISFMDHENRGGVGAAIISGFRKALADNIDVMAVMAGDGQMDPAILDRILDPVVKGEADYSKGDRLSIPQFKRGMSAWRVFGNFLLTWLNRIASGYWHVADPQNGYTAISREALGRINLDNVEKGFAFENDLLVKLHVCCARVVNIPHPARYRGEHSKIQYGHFIVGTSWLLLKDFLWRLWIEHGTTFLKRVKGSRTKDA